MGDLIFHLLVSSGLLDRWRSEEGWATAWGYLHIGSDLAISGAYTLISMGLMVAARRRKEPAARRLLQMFAGFLLDGSLVHLLDAVEFFLPVYRLSGFVKLLTAVVSWITLLTLVRLSSQAMELSGLRSLNRRLKEEMRRRSAAERRLSDSERRFQVTFENAGVGIAHVGIDGSWLRVNEKLCEIVGYSQDDLLSRRFQDITYREDLPRDMARAAAMRAGELEQFTSEKRYVRKDGSLVWVSLTVSVVSISEGFPDYFIAVIQDINDRKLVEQELLASERRLKLAKELVSVGVLLQDYRQETMELDETAARLLDLPANQRLPSEEVHGRFHLEDRPAVEIQLAAETAELESRRATEHRVVHSNGQELWLSVCKQLDYGASSEGNTVAQRSLIAVFDLTERKRHEALLETARRQAELANQARGEFLANMSHEIRTPMAAIMGHVDILLQHLKDPDDRQCAHTIKRNGRHLLEIINDILDLSRIEAGKLEVDTAACDLKQLVSDIDLLMQVRVDESKVEFRIATPQPIPRWVLTDSKRVKQILINLVGNAIKFTRRGYVELEVFVDEREKRLSLVVRDSGIGIEPRILVNLFQPFSQGDASRTREFGGSGLGLAISKRLSDLLNGNLEVESEAGKGSTFRLTIPLRLAPGKSELFQYQCAMVADDEVSSSLPLRLQGKVLLVDDRRDIRFVGQHFLEEAGAQVMTAEDGKQAIEFVEAQLATGRPFDAIVMDVHMPVMDGMAAVRELRKQGCETPIVALTADAMVDDRQRCLAAGYDDYLTKPIDAAGLVTTVGRLLQRGVKDA